ncbi:porin [Burkholderia gladioli]|uniref:porin n=1 Tax=Burkholderia gladioli TaxID=28095 RepID=UPI00163F1431|nr:porin [Burkholderia gladioli]
MKSFARRASSGAFACAAFAACAFATTPVHAQSSLQLYGQVDAWIGAQKFPGNQTAVGVQGGGMSTSYWGLRGTEDLGGGYRALFTVEDFFRPQSGKFGRFDGDTFFARNSYVGLETPYGTVLAGRLTTHLFISTILFNPLIDSYEFSPMVYHVFLGLGTFPTYTTDQGVVGDSGWNNAVSYTTPDFNGFSASAMYALGNQSGGNGAKKWSGQMQYFHGPLAATAVYQYVNFNNDPGDLGSLVAGMKSQGVAQFGISYDLRFLKLYGQYMYTRNDAQSGSWHINTAQGGMSMPLGTGSAMASYAYSRDAGGLDQTHQTWALGYDYPLSKRTDLYVAYMYDHLSNQSSGYTAGGGMRVKF